MTPQLLKLTLICAPLIHPITMGAIVDVESGGNPYAVSINYPQSLAEQGWDVPEIAPQPRSATEAARLAFALARQGYSTSLGLAQINIEHLGEFGLSVSQLLDPCTNLRLAERLLIRCQQQMAGADTKGTSRLIERTLSCYNSGNATLGLRNGYVSAIVARARALLNPHFPPQN